MAVNIVFSDLLKTTDTQKYKWTKLKICLKKSVEKTMLFTRASIHCPVFPDAAWKTTKDNSTLSPHGHLITDTGRVGSPKMHSFSHNHTHTNYNWQESLF